MSGSFYNRAHLLMEMGVHDVSLWRDAVGKDSLTQEPEVLSTKFR